MFAWHDKKINHKFILFTDFSNLISLRQIVAGQEEVKRYMWIKPLLYN